MKNALEKALFFRQFWEQAYFRTHYRAAWNQMMRYHRQIIALKMGCQGD